MRLFGKRPDHTIDDPDFGPIIEKKAGSWTGEEFQLWGYTSIQVMIAAGPQGPSAEQRSFVRSLRAEKEIRARIERSVASYALKISGKDGSLRLTSVYIPMSPLQGTWKVWFDMDGEEQYWFGAEIEGWERIVPFAED
jgi:hypothetical protein